MCRSVTTMRRPSQMQQRCRLKRVHERCSLKKALILVAAWSPSCWRCLRLRPLLLCLRGLLSTRHHHEHAPRL